jgi:hypothetical protein
MRQRQYSVDLASRQRQSARAIPPGFWQRSQSPSPRRSGPRSRSSSDSGPAPESPVLRSGSAGIASWPRTASPPHQLLLVAGTDRTGPAGSAVAEGNGHGDHADREALAGCGHDLLQHIRDGGRRRKRGGTSGAFSKRTCAIRSEPVGADCNELVTDWIDPLACSFLIVTDLTH